jgi:hypothetical protein
MANMFGNVIRKAVEGFANPDDSSAVETYAEIVATIIYFLFAIVIIALFGKSLWNSSIVELFSIAKPARSAWQLISLFIFIIIMAPV